MTESENQTLRISPAQKLALRKLQDGPISRLGMGKQQSNTFDALVRKGLAESDDWAYTITNRR